jgi:protein-S-isoprenylcysteine O-methyltransferase Ste14
LFCYGVFAATLAYTAGFLSNVVVPRSIDCGPEVAPAYALVVDVLLVSLFGLQHSGMARARFKDVWSRLLPRPVERSTYVLASCLTLGILYWQWRPLPEAMWQMTGAAAAAIHGLALLGLLLLAAGSLQTNHFDLVGLRQVWLFDRGRTCESLPLHERGLYGIVRHPLMLGLLIVLWATPTLSAGRLLFAFVATVYILLGIRLEEWDLVRLYGAAYEDYRRRVPMLLPWPRRGAP